jgi:hypothetical protein
MFDPVLTFKIIKNNQTDSFFTMTRLFQWLWLMSFFLYGCGSKSDSAEAHIDQDAVKSETDNTKPVIQHKTHTADEDSIKKDHGVEEDITLITKRYIDGDAQYAFIIHGNNPDYYTSFKRIFDFDESERKQYQEQYASSRARADSVATLGDEYSHLVKKWVSVYPYNGTFHAFLTCSFPRRWALTDSTFVHYYMDGPSPVLISGVEQFGNRYEIHLARAHRAIIFDRIDSVKDVFMITVHGTDHFYVTPLENISRFPLIMEHCTEDGVSPLVEFDKELPTTALRPSQTFAQYVSDLQEVSFPVRFQEDYYLSWTEKELPGHLFKSTGLDLTTHKAIGVVKFPNNHIVLVKKYYNGGTDLVITGLSFTKEGSYCCSKPVLRTSDSEDLDFAITGIYEIKLLKSGPESGTLETFILQDNSFVRSGEPVSIEDASDYISKN